MDCLFCNIANGNIPATIIYQDDHVIAFNDIKPQAPEHKIIIPRKHITTLNDVTQQDQTLLGSMMFTATQLAHTLHIAENGYRLVLNCNANGGQSVFHIHVHLLGGRYMRWPPG